MLATQTTDSVLEGKNVKQWIKEKIAQTLKTLQKRYVTTDAPVTSEDLEANQLCCALEAVFIQGLRSKHIRVEGGGARSRKGATLPQPVFWNLLKTVTHRDVILELEGLSFINTDVGRCRAWVRLALNDGLLECYLASLLREGGKLGGYYQPGALLLDPEDREVLLSLLQGLSSLAFQLSYKSAVLNEWTTTPLALAGLCPAVLADDPQLPSRRRESWDTVSQSSGGSGGSDRGGAEVISRGSGREVNGVCDFRSPLTASDLSLDTASLSQLSSSLGSDDPLQTQVQRSPERENWNLDINLGHDSHHRSIFGEESSSSSQDLIKEDMHMTSPAPDSLVESSTHSSSEDDSPRPPLPVLPAAITNTSVSSVNSAVLESEVLKSTISSHEFAVVAPSPVVTESFREEERWMEGPPATCSVITVTAMTSKPMTPTLSSPSSLESVENSKSTPAHRTSSILGRQTSSLSVSSFHKSPSWISEEDFYTPDSYRNASCEEADVIEVTQRAESLSPDPEPAIHQRPPSVIHRRQIGLSNPFRGLLKLGQLERRNAMGLWRDYYCELSPFEIRLYGNAEERSCCENCSLLRCEDVHLSTSGEGRFQIIFSGKKLYLRAPSRGEAEDWVDRILEAIEKLRPATREDQWEVLQSSADQEVPSPSSTPSSPGRAPLESPEQQEMDWRRPTDLEPDAIKEAVVCLIQEDRGWSSLVLSLSLEALKGFSVEDGHKMLLFMHPIESVRDVVPDVALGGPAFFKVLTAQETLTVRAENGDEAQSWRSLIRGALNSYLESEDDVTGEEVVSLGRGQGGSVQRLVQHRLKGDGLLLPYLTVVPTERGLDAQNFKCAGCPKQIGLSLGRVKLCEFSGQYYCDTCHYGDRVIIPSRMVHNWDLTAREVSRQAQKLLVDVEHEPLLNIDLLNPDLFDHSDTMATVRFLRQKLRLLGDYLLICRSEIQKKIANRLGQRTYLLESSHLYSVLDLRQIADDLYVSTLQSLIQISSSHVFNCDLCTQRGFICQICNKGDIIFPFQFDTTYRCKLCKTVFHSHCKTESFSCPRCERLQRYQERDLLE